MARLICIEGQGGAAKTPICTRLVAALPSALYVHAFHEVNTALGHDVYALWPNEPDRALELLGERLRAPRSEEVVVFDRGWLTMVMGLEEFGHHALIPRALEHRVWTAFIDQRTDFVRRRSSRLAERGEPAWDLDADRERRRRWASRCEYVVDLDGEADLDAVAADLLAAWSAVN